MTQCRHQASPEAEYLRKNAARFEKLAERCVAEAAVFEISLDDLEPKWGSIESIIYEAMVHLDDTGKPGD